ncbi:mycofactocin precursor MftA [Streptomyces sp. MS19]|uniref:mycofactocin precursor MftA n=1 Tax=Streptomyces sp. MS19 TaxID=3385972 RepID=UPI0039A29D47
MNESIAQQSEQPEQPEQPGAVATIDQDAPAAEALIEADELVEEVSIDGMCGVY